MKLPEEFKAWLIVLAFVFVLWCCFAVCHVLWYLIIRALVASCA